MPLPRHHVHNCGCTALPTHAHTEGGGAGAGYTWQPWADWCVYAALAVLPWAGAELGAACPAELATLGEAVEAYLVRGFCMVIELLSVQHMQQRDVRQPANLLSVLCSVCTWFERLHCGACGCPAWCTSTAAGHAASLSVVGHRSSELTALHDSK